MVGEENGGVRIRRGVAETGEEEELGEDRFGLVWFAGKDRLWPGNSGIE